MCRNIDGESFLFEEFFGCKVEPATLLLDQHNPMTMPMAGHGDDPHLAEKLSVNNDDFDCEADDGFDPYSQVGELAADFLSVLSGQIALERDQLRAKGLGEDIIHAEILLGSCWNDDNVCVDPELVMVPPKVEAFISQAPPEELFNAEADVQIVTPLAATQNLDIVTGVVDGSAVPDSLSESDQIHLGRYEDRCKLLIDRVVSVAKGYQTGLLLRGRPGTGKSHLVRKALDELRIPYVYRSGHMSAMGLYDELDEHPEDIIVIDDIPLVMQDRRAQQILLPALGGDPGKPRMITSSARNRGDRPEAIQFTGGIIAISNTQLRRDPLTNALASRTIVLDFEPSDGEIMAVIRNMACKGYEDLTPAECQEVATFIFDECAAHEYRIDLRIWFKGLQDYRQHRDGHAKSHWKDLIRSNMRQDAVAEVVQVSAKDERHSAELDKVIAAMAKFPGDSPRQIAETGFGKSKFYELRREVKRQS